MNLQLHLCLLSSMYALNQICEVLENVLLSKEWSLLAEGVEGVGTKCYRRMGRTGNTSSQPCLQRNPSME